LTTQHYEDTLPVLIRGPTFHVGLPFVDALTNGTLSEMWWCRSCL